MNQQDLEAMMLQMELWPYRQPTTEDQARQAQADLAFERAEADQREREAWTELNREIGGGG